jgi:outer membrane protein TolC
MQVFRHLVVVSVGVLFALSCGETGSAQTESSSPSLSNQSSQTPPPPSTSSPLPPDSATPSPVTPPESVEPGPTPVEPPVSIPETGSSGPAPDSLNPNPNPLQFPTKPEEVRIQAVQPITLEQAIELARRNNRLLEQTQLQVDRSRATLREQQAQWYPNVDLQTTLTRQKNEQVTQQFLTQSNELEADRSTALSGTVQVSYDVFTFGLRAAQIRAAERQLRSDELELEATLEQLALDVSNDYFDLQQADETVRINEAAVRNAEVSLRDTQAQERAGLGTRFDVLQAQVELANAVQNLTNARTDRLVARRQLAQRLSLAQSVDVVAADPVQIAGTWNLPLEDSIVLAFKNRAELEQQLVQRELNQQQRRAALASVKPNISLTAQYNVRDTFDDDTDIAETYSIAAGLQWRLFDGGAARARARQEEADIAISESRFADQRNQIRLDVEQAYTSLLSNRENIDTASAALEQARESLRLARLRFQAGVGTQSQVIDAEAALTRAEGNRIQAIIGYNRSLATLRRAVSNLAPYTPPAASVPTPAGDTPQTRQPNAPRASTANRSSSKRGLPSTSRSSKPSTTR